MRIARTAALLVLIFSGAARAAISFTPDNFYSATYFSNTITQYNTAGTVVGSLTTSDEIRGLAFGPDGLLYATASRGLDGFAVLAMNSAGAVQQTYARNVYAAGNISYGKLAVDAQHIYVAAQDVLTRFDIGNPSSGTTIYSNNQVFDVEILPTGNLLVASAYEVNEITPSGTFVRSIEPPGSLYTDVRGVEYDPATNNLFVTHLGHSGFFFKVMRIDFTTGALEEAADFHYADDMFLTSTGDLLVGSRTLPPRIYTQDLDQIGTLGTTDRIFVTQYVVPEPSAVLGAGVLAAAGVLRRSRR